MQTYRTAVRFKDGSYKKFDVCDVPDDLDSVREVIHRELQNDPPTSILIAVPNMLQARQEAA